MRPGLARLIVVFAVLWVVGGLAAVQKDPRWVAAVPATITPTPTPLESVNQDWRRIDAPGAPGGTASAGFCLDELRCWFVDSQMVLMRSVSAVHWTRDGGVTWQSSGEIGYAYRIVFFDDMVGFTNNGRTMDGGRIWSAVKAGDRPLEDIIFVPHSSVGYACDSSPKSYKTVDAGQTWQPRPGPCASYGSRWGVFLDENIAWKVAYDNTVTYTIDGWQTSRPLQVGTEGEKFSAIDFVDYQHGWVASRGSGAALYRTQDAGQTWERLPLPAPYYEVQQLDFLTPSLGWAAVLVSPGHTLNDVAFLRTDDGGMTWVKEAQVQNTSGGNQLYSAMLYFFSERLGWGSVGYSGAAGFFDYAFYKHYPSIALTPTPTATATNTPIPMTPTPTWTPYPLPVPGSPMPTSTPTATLTPTPTPTPASCAWTGQWDTIAGGQRFAMSLSQSGGSVAGTYGTEPRQIQGTTVSSALSGRWAGPPSYQEPQNAGRFVFVIASDCNSFTGSWGFDQSATDGGVWSGARVTASAERVQLVARLYQELLCREPDPEGLRTWAGSSATEAQLRTAIGGSAEGQQAAAARSLYLSTFGRDPVPRDCGGMRSWVDSGLGVGELRAGLEGSAEGQRVRAVRDLYIELLGRDPLGPDNTGLRSWVESGLSLESIRAAIMQSPEYRSRR